MQISLYEMSMTCCLGRGTVKVFDVQNSGFLSTDDVMGGGEGGASCV
jgi:hypothetical protein